MRVAWHFNKTRDQPSTTRNYPNSPFIAGIPYNPAYLHSSKSEYKKEERG